MGNVEIVREELRRLETIVERIERIAEKLEKGAPELWKEVREEIEDLVDDAREALDRIKSGKGEAEEVREIMNAIMPFFDKLGSIAREVVGTSVSQFVQALDGKKLGEDIGSLYERLKQAGMPEELVTETVKEYARKRIESVPSLSDLLERFLGSLMSGSGRIGSGEKGIERLEEHR